MEIITLRAPSNLSEDFCNDLLQQILKVNQGAQQPIIQAFRRGHIETDLSFHLRWCVKTKEIDKSDVGIVIANHLKGLGLVSHSVWFEEERDTPVEVC